LKTFRQFVFEGKGHSKGMFGKVGKKAEQIKTNIVRKTFPNKLRVVIAAAQSTGKAMYYDSMNDKAGGDRIRKWRNEIISGKRKLRGNTK